MALVCFKMHPLHVIFVVELKVTIIGLRKQQQKTHATTGRQQNLPAFGPSSCHILRRPSGVLWQNFDALFRSRPGQ